MNAREKRNGDYTNTILLTAKRFFKISLQYTLDNSINQAKLLDVDELETVRKIYDEAKIMLADTYRKTFHKLLLNDWHLTIVDGRQDRENARLRYKLL